MQIEPWTLHATEARQTQWTRFPSAQQVPESRIRFSSWRLVSWGELVALVI